eukprot:scaffold7141_cov107-Isochrysis_galbana.AAC.6
MVPDLVSSDALGWANAIGWAEARAACDVSSGGNSRGAGICCAANVCADAPCTVSTAEAAAALVASLPAAAAAAAPPPRPASADTTPSHCRVRCADPNTCSHHEPCVNPETCAHPEPPPTKAVLLGACTAPARRSMLPGWAKASSKTRRCSSGSRLRRQMQSRAPSHEAVGASNTEAQPRDSAARGPLLRPATLYLGFWFDPATDEAARAAGKGASPSQHTSLGLPQPSLPLPP